MHFDASNSGEHRANAIIGRSMVDKVGEDQTGPFGGKIAPFTAHVEANDLGKTPTAKGLARPPAAIANGQATVGTDANGNWAVSNVVW